MRQTAPQGWHREDIRAELRKKHGTLSGLSVRWGLHPCTIAVALGTPGIAAVERRIAAELGLSPHTLWPDRWTPEGVPLPRPGKHRSPKRPAAHRQNREAI
jgi:Ner family transcriptional regulator